MKNLLYRRFSIMFLFLWVSFFSFIAIADESHIMNAPKGLSLVQHAIEKNAKKFNIQVKIDWEVTKDQSYIAVISYGKIGKQISFTNAELESASRNNLLPETTKKIQKVISELPGTNPPPSVMP